MCTHTLLHTHLFGPESPVLVSQVLKSELFAGQRADALALLHRTTGPLTTVAGVCPSPSTVLGLL